MVSAAGSLFRIENWETIYPARCLPGGEQDVLCHRGVEKALRLGAVMRLAQNPHELGHHGLCGHIVSLQHLQIGFQAVAHMVDADVAALAGDLRCEDDEPPFRHPAPQAVKKPPCSGRPPTPKLSMISASFRSSRKSAAARSCPGVSFKSATLESSVSKNTGAAWQSCRI